MPGREVASAAGHMNALLAALLLCAATAAPTRDALAAEPNPRHVVVNLAGDVGYPDQFGRGDVIEQRQERLFEQVQAVLDSAQLNFANLECPFTRIKPFVPNMWPLSCTPSRLSYPIAAGLNVFSLANNHMTDAGVPGIRDTIAGLRARSRPERPLWWTGAGTSPEQAQAVTVVKAPGTEVEIAWLAVTGGRADGALGSLRDPGLLERIRAASEAHDLVIVSVHFGTEHVHVPTTEIAQRYRQLVAAGADVVVGHHPHVMQGVERHRSGVILYSLGDLSFGSMSLRHHAQGGRLYSLIARLTIDGRELSQLELIPTYHDNLDAWTLGAETLPPRHCTPQLLSGAFAQALLDELDRFTAAIPGAQPTRLVRIGDRSFVDLGRPIEDRSALLAQQAHEREAARKVGGSPRPATADEMQRANAPAELRSFPKPGSLRGLPPIH